MDKKVDTVIKYKIYIRTEKIIKGKQVLKKKMMIIENVLVLYKNKDG